jgi:hypothetical protein
MFLEKLLDRVGVDQNTWNLDCFRLPPGSGCHGRLECFNQHFSFLHTILPGCGRHPAITNGQDGVGIAILSINFHVFTILLF